MLKNWNLSYFFSDELSIVFTSRKNITMESYGMLKITEVFYNSS